MRTQGLTSPIPPDALREDAPTQEVAHLREETALGEAQVLDESLHDGAQALDESLHDEPQALDESLYDEPQALDESLYDEPEAPAQTAFFAQRYDRPLLLIVLMMMGFGLVMVYSSSIYMAGKMAGADGNLLAFGDYYLKRQLLYMGLAIGAMGVLANLHHTLLERFAFPIFLGAFVVLCLALVPGIGESAKGASRWINLGGQRLQPSEFIKVAWLILLAAHLSYTQRAPKGWWPMWRAPLFTMAALALVLNLQHDFGTTAICGVMMLLMVWVAGARTHQLALVALIAMVAGAVLIFSKGYRQDRVLSFAPGLAALVNLVFGTELSVDSGDTYQIQQSLISFGSGGVQGLGLGSGRQKLSHLPEAHTDFILGIVGEELGFVGVALLVCAFVLLCWRGLRIVKGSTSAFGALLAFAIVAEITLQAIINMMVVTRLAPTKGLTLPFISYGGSSLISLGIAVGILLNISRRQPPPVWMHRWLPDDGAGGLHWMGAFVPGRLGRRSRQILQAGGAVAYRQQLAQESAGSTQEGAQ